MRRLELDGEARGVERGDKRSALLEELRRFREGLLTPTNSSFKQQQKEIPKLLGRLLPLLKALVASDLMRTCSAIEPNNRVLRPD